MTARARPTAPSAEGAHAHPTETRNRATSRRQSRVNPRTQQRQQSESQWVQKQITTKTTRRIEALQNADTRPTAGGSSTVPELSRLQQIRRLHFKLDGDSHALRAAVHAELAALRGKFPDWTFTVEFGIKILPPPLPDRDARPVGP